MSEIFQGGEIEFIKKAIIANSLNKIPKRNMKMKPSVIKFAWLIFFGLINREAADLTMKAFSKPPSTHSSCEESLEAKQKFSSDVQAQKFLPPDGRAEDGRADKSDHRNQQPNFKNGGGNFSLFSLASPIPLSLTSGDQARIVLLEENSNSQILGIPQSYEFKCQQNKQLFPCAVNLTLKEYDKNLFKLYYYPKSSKNLIDPTDIIALRAGASTPITLWPLSVGTVDIDFNSHSLPRVSIPVNDFNSPLKNKLSINEIFYSTNKNLVWLEIHSTKNITTPLKIHLWNSNLKFKKSIAIEEQTYLANSYNVFAFLNSNFTNRFSWHVKTSGKNRLIPTKEIIDITSSGVIALSSEGKYIDSVYYDKNWFKDFVFQRSLQRKTTAGYAFNRKNFDISVNPKATPLAINNFSKEIYFSATLIPPRITRAKKHLNIVLDYPLAGHLSIFLYDTDNNLLGRVYDKTLTTAKVINLCLEKANLVLTGLYQLVFYYETEYGSQQLNKGFLL